MPFLGIHRRTNARHNIDAKDKGGLSIGNILAGSYIATILRDWVLSTELLKLRGHDGYDSEGRKALDRQRVSTN